MGVASVKSLRRFLGTHTGLPLPHSHLPPPPPRPGLALLGARRGREGIGVGFGGLVFFLFFFFPQETHSSSEANFHRGLSGESWATNIFADRLTERGPDWHLDAPRGRGPGARTPRGESS